MKSTGIVRRIDSLGRIVLPKELRDNLNIQTDDEIEIYTSSDNIILAKHIDNDLKNEADSIIDSLSELVDVQIFISDKEKIVSNGILENKKLDETLIELLNNREVNNNNLLEKHFDITGYFLIYPLIKNSIAKGLIIMIKKSQFTKEEEYLCRMLATIIKRNI